LCVLSYLVSVHDAPHAGKQRTIGLLNLGTTTSDRSPATLIGWSVGLAILVVCVLTWVAIRADNVLPKTMASGVATHRNVILTAGGSLVLIQCRGARAALVSQAIRS
jgi:hypothetical protein